MRLPNLNWPNNLYRDVIPPMADVDMAAGDDDVPDHVASQVGDNEFESFTISGFSARPLMTAPHH